MAASDQTVIPQVRKAVQTGEIRVTDPGGRMTTYTYDAAGNLDLVIDRNDRRLAYAYDYPDALAGAAAAGTIKGPILLVNETGPINVATATELTRLSPAKIVVLGGTGVISDAVFNALTPYATEP